MATKEYHSKHQANKLTLVFSTNGGGVLVNEDPNSTHNLKNSDCHFSSVRCPFPT
jgi:hypothetical protein